MARRGRDFCLYGTRGLWRGRNRSGTTSMKRYPVQRPSDSEFERLPCKVFQWTIDKGIHCGFGVQWRVAPRYPLALYVETAVRECLMSLLDGEVPPLTHTEDAFEWKPGYEDGIVARDTRDAHRRCPDREAVGSVSHKKRRGSVPVRPDLEPRWYHPALDHGRPP
jgi:hypothetical protein